MAMPLVDPVHMRVPDSGPLFPSAAAAVVATAVRSPSLHNAQPWLFRAVGDRLELRADRTRQLRATDPDGRQLVVSCGAALLGVRLAVRHLGRVPEVQVLPDPADADLLAVVRSGPPVPENPSVERLLAAVATRRSHRGRFAAAPVPSTSVFRLQEAAEAEGCRLVVVHRPGARRAVADVVAAAERARQSDTAVRTEAEAWTPAPEDGRRDGVPSDAYPRTPEPAGPQELTVRDFALGRDRGRPRPLELPVPGGVPPVMAVLLSGSDDPTGWLAAGSALHRVLLTAAADGLTASLHGQAVELDGLRRLLRDELLVDEHPQMLLQIGSATPAAGAVTPRRAVEEVLEVVLPG